MSDPLHAPIAMLFDGVWSQYAVATAPKYRDFFELIHTHDFSSERLHLHQALLIPFQSNQILLCELSHVIFDFLAMGRRVAVFGDASDWIGGQWQERPVDNSWWARQPAEPPIIWTDFSHPLFAGLTERQAGWHHHGVYASIPLEARILQRSRLGEVVCWETHAHGGTLLAAMSDPIVERGVQQIRHLDHFVDRLVYWLCRKRPDQAPMTFADDQFSQPRSI